MEKGLEELEQIQIRLKHAKLSDTSSEFNTNKIECLELDNIMATAVSTAYSAYYRTESRGAHSRADYAERDDEKWLCHSIYDPKDHSMSKREVNMSPKKRDPFPPIKRVY